MKGVKKIILARCAGGPSLSLAYRLTQALDCRDSWADRLRDDVKEIEALKLQLRRDTEDAYLRGYKDGKRDGQNPGGMN